MLCRFFSSSHSFSDLSISIESNFNHIRGGESSPNCLLVALEVYVTFCSKKDAIVLLGYGHPLTLSFFYRPGKVEVTFVQPTQCKRDREVYRTIGDNIRRLQEIDAQLRKLGAVAGRGGVPELSEHLIQDVDFDEAICLYRNDPVVFTSFLCLHTKCDRRKREAELKPLAEERLHILPKLCSYNQDECPFTSRREFA
jgi:hypothetical protein